MTTNAIPTKYGGVQFRSRLEARWAAFFDLLGWQWEYEPIDLDGYIPDFLVSVPGEPKVLVEIKPIVDRDDDHVIRVDAIRKIIHSGWRGPALLCGAVLLDACPRRNVPRLGEAVGDVCLGTVPGGCRRCPRMYLLGDGIECDNDVDNRLCPGCPMCTKWCNCCDSDKAYAMARDVTPFWREAGNRVQWRSP